MPDNRIKQLAGLGQSVWVDNLRRSFILNGQFSRWINEDGVSGVTSNPTIFEKAISSGAEYDAPIREMAARKLSPREIYEGLAFKDIADAADIFRPVFDAASGKDGFVSIEVEPDLAYDEEGTFARAREIRAAINRPNIMIKVPATKQGVGAIRRLIAEGVSVNATLLFSVKRYKETAEAFVAGLEERLASGKSVEGIASVASFFVSRVDSAADKELDALSSATPAAGTLKGKLAIANCKLAWKAYKEIFHSERFLKLAQAGAAPQRLLWASTSTKNPAYKSTIYIDELIAGGTVNTVPDATLDTFRREGTPALTLDDGMQEAAANLKAAKAAGLNLDAITKRLEKEGVDSFAKSFDKLMESLTIKAEVTMDKEYFLSSTAYNEKAAALAAEGQAKLSGADFTARFWKKDATVWKTEPEHTAIINKSLGWTDVAPKVLDRMGEIEAFVAEAKKEFTDCMVLGMGGSSLAPEVFRCLFPKKRGALKLHVLDSTHPDWVLRMFSAVDPKTTLFIFASKSGGTVEPTSFFKYAYGQVSKLKENPSANFIAITDPGTGLEKIATEMKFRKIFLNYSDIGGRFSALSLFGLVPAALGGVDIRVILQRAIAMSQASAADIDAAGNQGVRLGAAMGSAAMGGMDKITFMLPSKLQPFGLWMEQLIAESTGKEGKGIVPVAAEKLQPNFKYAGDRLFVLYDVATLPDAKNAALADKLSAEGKPVIRIKMRDVYDLGAEYMRWEIATAAAGAIMGIDPFDQPNVQEAKTLAQAALKNIASAPGNESPEGGITFRLSPAAQEALGGREISLKTLSADFKSLFRQGDYAGLLSYSDETKETAKVLASLRTKLLKGTKTATLFGYGPRYLHSTGQLHKGGANNGVFLVIFAEPSQDAQVPGESYTFGQLARAQAEGDFQAFCAKGRRALMLTLPKPQDEAFKTLMEIW